MTDRNVLCFESRPESMMGVRSTLQGLGYQVVVASSAREAVDLLKEKPVEGVLLEYDLPDEICSQIRAEVARFQPDVPVVLFAGIMVTSAIPLLEPYVRSSGRRDASLGDFRP